MMALNSFKKILNCKTVKTFSSNSPLSLSVRAWTTNQRRCQSTQPEWQSALTAAEKLVGNPTSYITLRSLLSDEMTNVATHLKKLMGTTHPLVETAKQIIYDQPQTLHTRGLLVLLISKCIGLSNELQSSNHSHEDPDRVLPSQRTLAEITEMIYTAQIIHRGVVDLTLDLPKSSLSAEADSDGRVVSCNKPLTSINPDYEYGNKIAILCGDYLLANACEALAALENSQVVELVSSAIGDFTEAEFIGYRDSTGKAMPSTSFDLNLWQDKTFLSRGSLIAKSSKSAALLAGHTDEVLLNVVYDLSKHFACAWQAQLELQSFVCTSSNFKALPVELTSLPVVLHLQSHCSSNEGSRKTVDFFRSVRQLSEDDNTLQRYLTEEVLSSEVGIAATKEVTAHHCTEAVKLLEKLPNNDARKAIGAMISALNCS